MPFPKTIDTSARPSKWLSQFLQNDLVKKQRNKIVKALNLWNLLVFSPSIDYWEKKPNKIFWMTRFEQPMSVLSKGQMLFSGPVNILQLCVSKFWVCWFSVVLSAISVSYGALGSCLNPESVIKPDGHAHTVLGVSTYYLVMQMPF